jgi:hypothetical protein
MTYGIFLSSACLYGDVLVVICGAAISLQLCVLGLY